MIGVKPHGGAVESVMRLGTVEGLDVEAARACEVVAGALADQPASSRTASSFRRHSCSRVSRGNGEN